MTLYQPVPFVGQWGSATRLDCEERYQAMRSLLGEMPEKTVVDIGCANGFFGFRFLQDGAPRVVGIEPTATDRALIEQLSHEHHLSFVCVPVLDGLTEHFDVGLYLDLHGHNGVNYLPWLREHVTRLFASTSGDGRQRNVPMQHELTQYFHTVHPIYTGYAGRTIFQCV